MGGGGRAVFARRADFCSSVKLVEEEKTRGALKSGAFKALFVIGISLTVYSPVPLTLTVLPSISIVVVAAEDDVATTFCDLFEYCILPIVKKYPTPISRIINAIPIV